jgi:hypothetical protein
VIKRLQIAIIASLLWLKIVLPLSLLSTSSPFSFSIFTVSLQAFAPNPATGLIVPRRLIVYTGSHNYMDFHLIGLKTLKRHFFHIFLQKYFKIHPVV